MPFHGPILPLSVRWEDDRDSRLAIGDLWPRWSIPYGGRQWLGFVVPNNSVVWFDGLGWVHHPSTLNNTTRGYAWSFEGYGLFVATAGGANATIIERAADPASNWTAVLTMPAAGASWVGVLPCSLVALRDGRMAAADYDNDGQRIWFSNDYGVTWGGNAPDYDDGNPAISTQNTPFTHIHGLMYLSASDELVVFTGDYPANDHALVAPLDAIWAAPADWVTNWRLTTNFATRVVPQQYCLNTNLGTNGKPTDEQWRIVGGYYDPDTGRLYWIPDAYDATIARIWCYDRASATTRAVGGIVTTGPGWCGHRDPRTGVILLGAGSELHSDRTRYSAGSDQYMRLYGVSPDGRKAAELRRWPRADHEAWHSGSIFVFAPSSLLCGQGRTWLCATDRILGIHGRRSAIGQIIDPAAGCGMDDANLSYATNRLRSLPINLLLNGDFRNALGSEWTAQPSANPPTIARVTDVLDTYKKASLSVTPAAVGDYARAQQNVTTVFPALVGNVVTLSARIRVFGKDSSYYIAGQRVGIGITGSDWPYTFAFTDSLPVNLYPATGYAWVTWSITTYFPTVWTYALILLHANTATASAERVGAVWFSDVILATGGPGPRNAIPGAVL